MKRIMTFGSLIILLAAFAILGAQNHHGGNGQSPYSGSNPPNHNYNNNNHNNNWQNGFRNINGYLIINEKDIKHNARLGFHVNLRNLELSHIQFTSGKPRKNTYGMIVQQPNGGYAYFRLDKKGNELARTLFAHRWRNRDSIYVQVNGKLDLRDRLITVRSIQRINGHNNPGCDNDGPHHWG